MDFYGNLHACAGLQLLPGWADEMLLVQGDTGFVGRHVAGGIGGAAGAAAASVTIAAVLAIDFGGISADVYDLAGKQAVFLEWIGRQLDLGGFPDLDKTDVLVFDGCIS